MAQATTSKGPYVFAVLLVAAVLAVYLPGLQNGLVFDDLPLLRDGTVFRKYGSLLHFKQRMLSYGSFVWVQDLLGQGWWKQRLVNLALHLGTVAALYALLKALVGTARFPQDFEEQPHFERSRSAAQQVGVALFALNPVAVYAVAYLTQRSIVMATLFAVLACWLFVRGAQTGRAAWFAGALLSYVAAVLSKEYALMTAALAVPLYIYLRRPPLKQTAFICAATLLVLAIAGGLFWRIYGDLIGHVFDPQSRVLAQQLEALRPGVAQQLYPLSILNETALFFAYGILWALPNIQWMSIDLRPAFPLGFASWPLLGAVGYLALLAASIWAVLRRSDLWGLAAVLLLFPLLCYFTEFATVWLQDPFVLYRSYLWAVALPGLVAIVLTGFQPRTIYMAGMVLGLLFGALALERVASLKDTESVWRDAVEKIDLKAPANTIGRGRPFLNLGTYYMEKSQWALAQRAFANADALGDATGNARFNLGVALQAQNQNAQALQAFNTVQARDFTPLQRQQLYYRRGDSELALGQATAALQSYDAALRIPANALPGGQRMQQIVRMQHAQAAMAANRFDVAIADFHLLLQQLPGDPSLESGLGLALAGQGDTARAMDVFNQLLARKPDFAQAFYGRAMAYQGAGNQAEALKDLEQAIRLDPRNPQYQAARAHIAAPPPKKP